jgi:hypothetical protein
LVDHDFECDGLSRVTTLRYCPRCDRETEPDEALCAVCGESTADQGFCPVCERSWCQPAGSDCPKHEIPLEDRPPAVAGLEAVRWVTVARFADTLAAEAPRLRLEAEGIPSFLEGERMGQNTLYNVATGGVKLQVPVEQVADARVLLAQTWAPPAEPDDLDDAWEELAPAPWETRRRVMKVVILVILFGPVIVSLFTFLAASLGR